MCKVKNTCDHCQQVDYTFYVWSLYDTTSYSWSHATVAVLNRRIPPAGLLFVAPELLYPHRVFWLGQHVYTRTCLHANDTQTAGSLTAASTTFNFHFRFWSSSQTEILQAVGLGA